MDPEINLNKKRIRNGLRISVVLTAGLIAGLIGWLYRHHAQQERMISRATEVAQYYIKQNYHYDIEFTDSQILGKCVSSHIVLYGHIKGREDKKVNVTVNYENYEMIGIGGYVDLFPGDKDKFK
ncbi:hypothetical protein Q5741_14390 [Paenibacillus sp. JX-17]|uniref:DUF1433 domain-containing protein n=1 Tax=Paenibacillus lacisoli TaxID=3064525 RepID=A0ABT9CE92_9BACL|nr:hypothetical protein [Paenibacillus sp. JX-17]MDO7907595.1 hypothetical protein [Paenibacillus sp. JX-17]